jgi:hypothetical protein
VLGATTHLQTYLAEKIFQRLLWMRRYELQKQAIIVNSMADLLTTYSTPKSQTQAITHNMQAQLWSDPKMLKIIEAQGHTPESLAAKAMSNAREEIQKSTLLSFLASKPWASYSSPMKRWSPICNARALKAAKRTSQTRSSSN